MFVVTLTTNPARPALDAGWPDNLCNAWGGAQVTWLAPGEAAEFPLDVRPTNFDEIRDAALKQGIDLNIQGAKGRKKALLLADMDSTMIEQECIDELAEVAGVGDRVKDVTARAMNGELDFEDALRARLALMKGLDANVIQDVLKTRISLAPGGPVLLATMLGAKAYTALVSGGFTHFTAAVRTALGFHTHKANVLGIADGRLTGHVVGPILGRAAKVDALNGLCRELEIEPAQVIAVGDGANDLGMLNLAGAGVAMHAKPAVAAQCDLRINHGDLTALLYLQGYAKSNFARTSPARLA